MNPESIVQTLLSASSEAAQRHYLLSTLPKLDEITIAQLAQSLKENTIRLLRVSAQQALDCAASVALFASITNQPHHIGLGLRLQAMVYTLGFGRHHEALGYYDEAMAIFQQLDDVESQALLQVTRIWAASHVEQYDKVVADAEWAKNTLASQERWRDVATLHNNLAIIHNRFGHFQSALDALNVSRAAYIALGQKGEPFLTNVENNRAFALYALGEYRQSIAAGEKALALAQQNQQTALTARAKQNLGLTYYGLGHYNHALKLFDEARTIWQSDNRIQEIIQLDLTVTYCLLQLRRFRDVLTRCANVRELITQHGLLPETPFSLLNEARALSALGHHNQAIDAFEAARQIIQTENSPWDLAQLDLVEATLLFLRGDFAASYRQSVACIDKFEQLESPLDEAAACLLVARSAILLLETEDARSLLDRALTLAKPHKAYVLIFEGHFLLGCLAQRHGQTNSALDHYKASLAALEQLQSHTMIEHRPDFLADADKQELIEALVKLSFEANQVSQALDFVERTKSRALLSLLSYRVDVPVQPRVGSDQLMVNELNQLRRKRNALYRQQLFENGPRTPETLTQLSELEQEQTQLWHRLLIHNAEYLTDASLDQVETVDPTEYLDANTMLLEFFILEDRFVVFVANRPDGEKASEMRVHHLEVTVGEVDRRLRALKLNMQVVARSKPDQILSHLPNAQSTLFQLYQMLLAPIKLILKGFSRLIIVPHGRLHYLPFHALFDGEKYLIDSHTISYLPASSFLPLCRRPKTGEIRLLSVAHSLNGHLPYAVDEAKSIAPHWPHTLLLEDEASLINLQHHAGDHRLLHLATHGEFRSDNPLFSGLTLADGLLTTLDVFNLSLQASLVTLSACNTGRHVIGGGDELLGLTRAFLSAGASSLIISHWAVEDVSTACLMQFLYAQLAAGSRKDAALQQAQRNLSRGTGFEHLPASLWEPYHTHPYFWAPFYLLGHPGRL